MNKYKKLQHTLDSLKVDFNKFYEKGNSAAGTRIRSGLQELKKLAQEIRINIQERKKYY